MKKKLTTFCILLTTLFSGSHVFAQYTMPNAFPSLSAFSKPVEMTFPNDGTNRLFVVQQGGLIYIIPKSGSASTKEVFLDLRDSVVTNQNEMGLLGLAFHPDYKTNGYFYVNYNRYLAGTYYTYVARYSVNANDPDVADKSSKKILMKFVQPYTNHNGGCLRFGPDGYLYITTGDGGSGNDPQNHAQNLGSFLGKILRIDVNTTSGSKQYGIPGDNPFVSNTSALPEIYAYGLRNPWKFSFDSENGTLWASDVGQNYLEEVNIIEKGKNYGWKEMEGFQCRGGGNNCNKAGLALPVYDYYNCAVDGKGNCSVTGGYVYRGATIPELVGKYIFGDYSSGRVWAINYQANLDTTVTQIFDGTFTISGFALDQDKELYALGHGNGIIYKLVKPNPTGLTEEGFESQNTLTLYPNPSENNTVLGFVAQENGVAKIRIISLNGNVALSTENSYVLGANKLPLETNQLNKGVYFVEMEQNGIKRTAKFIKQ